MFFIKKLLLREMNTDVESLTNFHKLPNRISANSRIKYPQTPELHCTNDHYLIKSRHEKIQKKSR